MFPKAEDEAVFEFVIKDKDGVSVLRVKAEKEPMEVKQHWQKDISKAKEEWNRRRNTLDGSLLCNTKV